MEVRYLIKISRKNKRYYCGESNLYVSYVYDDGTWFGAGRRKKAKAFTAKEAADWLRGKKGFSMVKK
jgi:hypothetical protein